MNKLKKLILIKINNLLNQREILLNEILQLKNILMYFNKIKEENNLKKGNR